MNQSKKRTKRIIAIVISFVLSIFLIGTGLSYSFASAAPAGTLTLINADLPSSGIQVITDENGAEHSINKSASVTIGEEINFSTLGGTLNVSKIRTPKGKYEFVIGNKYRFTEVGFYTLVVGEYQGMRIECVADNYELSVDAALVPTYVAVGSEVVLPQPKILNSKGETVTEGHGYTFGATLVTPASPVSVSISSDYKISATANSGAGSYFVRYFATKGGITRIKDFTIQSQKDFTDEEKPSLSVVGVSSNANVRTKVVLPKATATDNFDTNVKVVVTVKTPDDSVIYQATEKNNVVSYDETKPEVFDNEGNLSFYPSVLGKYVVNYVATDDNGNETKYAAIINVKDGRAPIITVKDESLIPSEWGFSVSNESGTTSALLKIPAAKAYDNQVFEGTTSFETNADIQIKDPNGDYIYNQVASTQVNLNDCVTGNKDTGIQLDLSKASKGNGTYTVIYRATDAQKLVTTKEYKISVTDSYSVSSAPSVNTTGLIDFLSVGDSISDLNTLGIVTSATEASTGNASKVSLSESVYRFQPTGGTEETLDLTANGAYFFTKEGVLTVEIKAKDPVGNMKSETVTVPVIGFQTGNNGSMTAPDEGDLRAATVNKSDLADNTLDFFVNDDVEKSGIMKIVASNNVGFEAYVSYLKEGASVDSAEPSYVRSSIEYVEESVNADGKSITFTSAKVVGTLAAGKYTLVIRAFDQGKTLSIWNYSVTVTDRSSGGSDITPVSVELMAANDGSVSAYQAQILPKYNVTNGVLGRVITGSRYAVMGRYFVPMTSNETYTVNSHAVSISDSKYTFNGKIVASYTTEQSNAITFSVYDDYDSYYAVSTAAQKVYAKVPNVSVVSPNGNITALDVSVTTPNGGKADIVGANGVAYVEGEDRYFEAARNGVYTISYTAKTLTSNASYTLTITIGDIVKPVLTIETAHDTYMKQGSEFKFSKLTAEDNITTSGNLKYSRLLTSPDGSTVLEDAESAAGVDKATLDQIGTYTVTYTVEDEAGNKTIEKYQITISKKSSGGSATQTVTTVLIVVVVLLIIGLLIYFFIFRKIDFDKKKKAALAKKSTPALKQNSPAKTEEKEEVEVQEVEEVEPVIENDEQDSDSQKE